MLKIALNTLTGLTNFTAPPPRGIGLDANGQTMQD
jgi:hypothetical protein